MVTASLDMGAEKMVMALASVEGRACRLLSIKHIASQGIECGIINDLEKVRDCIHIFMSELIKDREVDVLNIVLPAEVLRMFEHTVNVSIQGKCVNGDDLVSASQRCRMDMEKEREELVDIIPVAYSVDRGDLVADPIGCVGRQLEATFQVYLAQREYLDDITSLFNGYNIGNVFFYSTAKAYMEALDMENTKSFALVDLGASGINVELFQDGMLEYEARLPLGMRTIDKDIMLAFAVNAQQARKLKYEYGQALRSSCKYGKIQIPDTNLTIENRDLATVVQSRVEELLEGVVFLLQKWGFDNSDDEVLLTGGGSRLQDLDLLLNRYVGHPVNKAVVKRVQTQRVEVLSAPEYLVALGLLFCKHPVDEQRKDGVWKKTKDLFSKFLGV